MRKDEEKEKEKSEDVEIFDMLINVNDKREYSLCSSKRLVLFENRC
jgi:hypothetical protein